VLVESIYSVLGDAAPLADLVDVCVRYDALLIADEAHALGVGGPGGRGLLHDAGLHDSPHVVATLTLSKSLGAQGGAVLASSSVRDHLVNTARPFIYDTGLAPAAAGAAHAALDVISDEPERVDRVRAVAAVLAEACSVPPVAGAVLAVAMPGPQQALTAVQAAADQGVRIGCFRPPSTPDGISRLRLTAHAHLTDEELDRARTVLAGLL
jgi:8-amino-7-oxononanoate synthase